MTDLHDDKLSPKLFARAAPAFSSPKLFCALQLAALAGAALSVAVDWVGRAVFWSEQDDSGDGAGSIVRKLYLDRDHPVTILRREGVVRQLAVAPLNR